MLRRRVQPPRRANARETTTDLRRAQLITPFGVGALSVAPDGSSMICCGLDAWFNRKPRQNGNTTEIQRDEFTIFDWRLQRKLGVEKFILPPDWHYDSAFNHINCEIPVPFYRFPKWHYCPKCYGMQEIELTQDRRPRCPNEACATRRDGTPSYAPFLIQMSLVAVCAHGHIQDFPWREWAHGTAFIPQACRTSSLEIRTGESYSMSDWSIKCNNCDHPPQVLGNVMASYQDQYHSYLSNSLGNEPFLCNGSAPWLNQIPGTGCGQQLWGVLRSASNLYYAHLESAIYLRPVTEDIISLLQLEGNRQDIEAAFPDCTPATVNALASTLCRSWLREDNPRKEIFAGITSEEIRKVLVQVLNQQRFPDVPRYTGDEIYQKEYQAINRPADLETLDLIVRPQSVSEYLHPISSDPVENYFSSINLIPKLRETRVHAGFNRYKTDQPTESPFYVTPLEMKLLMSRNVSNWLPAYIVRGEGIFLVLQLESVIRWENSANVLERYSNLLHRFPNRYGMKPLTPRYILIHTLAHLLINRIVFECGYTSAALRERIFCSQPDDSNTDFPRGMAGVLIYTAAGDSEGTLGGLVKLGKKGTFERILQRALLDALWCSGDPVCMETRELTGGQGPDRCNLAACHHCALLPETACEQFNRFLDRAAVIGDPMRPELQLGFFEGSSWLNP